MPAHRRPAGRGRAQWVKVFLAPKGHCTPALRAAAHPMPPQEPTHPCAAAVWGRNPFMRTLQGGLQHAMHDNARQTLAE
jgi:hypothetical protein